MEATEEPLPLMVVKLLVRMLQTMPAQSQLQVVQQQVATAVTSLFVLVRLQPVAHQVGTSLSEMAAMLNDGCLTSIRLR